MKTSTTRHYNLEEVTTTPPPRGSEPPTPHKDPMLQDG
jgi:hypothetical protein